MPLVIPESYMNLTLTITNSSAGASARSSVSLGMRITGTFGQTEFARIANLMRDGLTPRYDNTWTMGPTHGVFKTGGLLLAFDDTGTEAGTHAAQGMLPPAVALVVSKHTGLVGRAHRGRMYMPGLDEAKVTEDGIVDGAEVNAWQASMDALHAALLADTAVDQIALFHDTTSPFAGTADPISNFIVRNVVGNMRPRQRR